MITTTASGELLLLCYKPHKSHSTVVKLSTEGHVQLRLRSPKALSIRAVEAIPYLPVDYLWEKLPCVGCKDDPISQHLLPALCVGPDEEDYFYGH